MIAHHKDSNGGFMRTTVKGTLRNETAPPSAIHPVFEAISNSIHAIEDLEQPNGSSITIHCHYKKPETTNGHLADIGDRLPSIINNIEIQDTGIGFNEDNYNSFQDVNSMYKFNRGGRGKGRFSWLKIFQSALIESYFKDQDGYKKRCFEFSPNYDPEGIGNESTVLVGSTNTGTTINLIRPFKNIKLKLEDFANKTLFHFLPQFITGNIPIIIIKDDYIELNLLNEFSKLVDPSSKHEEFDLNDKTFTIHHILLKKVAHSKHKIYLCADRREVISYDLGSYLPHLPNTIAKNNDFYCYHAILESVYLDENVSSDRSRFNINQEDDCLNEISLKKIIELATYKISTYLENWVNPEKERSIGRIRDFIANEAPLYRNLLKTYIHELNNINANNMSELELDKALYAIKAKIEQGNRGEYKRFKELTSQASSVENIQKKYTKLLESLDDSAKDSLASYVVNRKKIIDIFERLLRLNKEGKYFKEVDVHDLIFPLRKDSDEVPFHDHNLWLIDEKLVFHQYLASDKSLKNYETIHSDSTDRPDIAVYQGMHGFSEDIQRDIKSSLTIIEFKRPGRDNYTSSDNPIDQVSKYALQIRNSECKDFYGRELRLKQDAPIYAYIICDITKSLRDILDMADYTVFPDGDGYYRYNRNMKMYTEVKSLDKLLRDATQRHKAFFNELGID